MKAVRLSRHPSSEATFSSPQRARSKKRAALTWGQILVFLCSGLGLGGCSGDQKKNSPNYRDPDTIRYRLLLRENRVDHDGAFRCYGKCQSQETPQGYVECLSSCPGFERDPGFKCADYETPPIAACLTVRKVDAKDELDPNLIVLKEIAGVLLVVGLASVCSATSSPAQCGPRWTPGAW